MSEKLFSKSKKYPELTIRQELIFDYISDYTKNHPYPPTVREIQQHLNVKSTSTIQYALDALESTGYISRGNGKMRSIIIEKNSFSQENDQIRFAPLVGRIAAGEPIFADQNITEYYPLPSAFQSNHNKLFMLEIQGESMIDAGILNGDFVIVEECSSANDGEIVAVLLDEAATVKRFYREEDHIRLQPENKTMKPILIYNNDIRILGKVIGLYRNSIQ